MWRYIHTTTNKILRFQMVPHVYVGIYLYEIGIDVVVVLVL
jgi:hypothetical protein